MDTRNALLIANLTGIGLGAAGTVLDALNWVSWLSLLLSLTGIGASAAATVWAQKAVILGISRTAGRYAAKAY
jgi:hypothetical protein